MPGTEITVRVLVSLATMETRIAHHGRSRSPTKYAVALAGRPAGQPQADDGDRHQIDENNREIEQVHGCSCLGLARDGGR